jgi:hypothetical protein
MFGPMVNKAVKGAAVGAGVGFVLWLGKQMIPKGGGGPQFPELNEHTNHVMLLDLDFRTMCAQMQPYAKFDPDAYCRLLLAAAQLIDMHVGLQRREVNATFVLVHNAAKYCSNIVESVRRLRAIVSAKTNGNAKVMQDFDEVAADLQRKCNEYSHNITFAVQYDLTC